MEVKTVIDKERGCGFRKPGALYLRAGGLMSACGRLPMDLEVCACCGNGYKPTRGWTWVNPKLMFKNKECNIPTPCFACPLNRSGMPERAGLLWIGGAYYEKPEDWVAECREQGVSRRVHALPKGLKVGETLVLAAHRRHHKGEDGKWVAAVFHCFTPTAVEYVVKGNETESQLQAMAKRGITPVKVVRDGDLPGVAEEAERASAEAAAKEKAAVEAARQTVANYWNDNPLAPGVPFGAPVTPPPSETPAPAKAPARRPGRRGGRKAGKGADK